MRRVGAFLAAAALGAIGVAVSLPGGTRAATPAGSVYPVPGSQVVSQAQIALRGIPAAQLGAILVWRSRSGLHLGHVQADSDGQGGGFLPDQPFADATIEHGSAHQVVFDSVAQEIDVKTGLVLFQWDSLDHLGHMTATGVAHYRHSPKLSANFEGNVQPRPGGDLLLGRGQQPYVTEFTTNGKLIFDARFVGDNTNYRAYRFPWRGDPLTRPAVAAASTGRPMAYTSWDGATDVASWRVLGGSSGHSLRAVSTARKSGFETAIMLPHTQNFVAVQALNRAGHVLNTSPTVRAH